MTVENRTTGVRPESPKLRQSSIGAVGMIFMVVAAAAPLTAMASNLSLSLGLGAGRGTVGLLLAVGALLALFAVGYSVLSRYVTNAGAYYAFITFGLGRYCGAAAAFIATLVYNLAAGGMIAATGYFAGLTVTSSTGLSAPWYAYGLVALFIMWFLGIRGVDLAQKVMTVVSLAQFAVILLLAVVVLAENPGGWSPDVVAPRNVFHGNVALSLVFCVLSFAGFEATADYGEEAKAGRRSIKIATYTALALLVGIFCFSTWSLVAAFDDVRAVAAKDPGSLFFAAADQYLGGWSGSLLSAVVTFSFLASAVAFHNIATRYMFALGRAGYLPKPLCKVHDRHGTPYLGSAAQTAVSVAMLVPFVLVGADPISNLFPAVSGITSLSLLALMTGCCVSVIAAALRGKVGESRWETVAAPAVAGLGLLLTAAIVIMNYQAVTGSDSVIVAYMPVVPALAGVCGVAICRRKGEAALDEHLAG
ncbi:APC family permease [Streptomyces cuspidosporus]|uniref:APC family permease n=1 Tax=Streptomyces cuspidosporus TaxID=66882 RepID=A0ABP5SI73_9ACTN